MAVLQVGVVEDERRALAAELHELALHAAPADLADALAHDGGAGEGHHVDVRRADDRLADLGAAAGDDVDDARAGSRRRRGSRRTR